MGRGGEGGGGAEGADGGPAGVAEHPPGASGSPARTRPKIRPSRAVFNLASILFYSCVLLLFECGVAGAAGRVWGSQGGMRGWWKGGGDVRGRGVPLWRVVEGRLSLAGPKKWQLHIRGQQCMQRGLLIHPICYFVAEVTLWHPLTRNQPPPLLPSNPNARGCVIGLHLGPCGPRST